MRTFIRGFVILAAVATIYSCASMRYVSDVEAAQARPMTLIKPLSHMEYIQSNGDIVNDIPSSDEASQLLASLVQVHFPEISSVIDTHDVKDEEGINYCLRALAGVNVKSLKSSTLPDSIKDLIMDDGGRYGVLVYSEGFTRDKNNYRKAVVGNVLLGIVTAIISFGAVSMYGVPILHESNVYLMVVDAKEDRVIYYDKSTPQEANPLDSKSVSRQLKAIRKHFK